jgi:ComF family protein
VRAVRSAFLLNEAVRGIIHALKYRGWHALAEPMAARMGALPWPREVEEEVELLIPVPLTAARARQRGYNQAELLAASLARKTGRQCDGTLLQRRRSVRSQTTLHPDERRANVAGAFQVRPDGADRLAGEHVLLVDDVWTTGATALACTEALLNAGARAVSVSTFARAVPELERLRHRVGSAATSA